MHPLLRSFLMVVSQKTGVIQNALFPLATCFHLPLVSALTHRLLLTSCARGNHAVDKLTAVRSLYRYLRLIVNLWAFWRLRPIPPPEKPSLTSRDVTVILPTLEGEGHELENTIESILKNEPHELILVTIEGDALQKATRTIGKMPASQHNKLRCLAVKAPNKRRQMARAIPEVTTKIIVFADDDVDWPRQTLRWMLAPFEKDRVGGVVTCQRLRRPESPMFSQRFWGFLGALYLERRNFDCAATTYMDGGVPCMSGRTVAYRTKIMQDGAFTSGFTSEKWWFNQYQLNADDDNFLTRWMVSHGWETWMQYHPECEVQTTLEDNPKFLMQCLRWARSNWRSNLTSMFTERHIWRYVHSTCMRAGRRSSLLGLPYVLI